MSIAIFFGNLVGGPTISIQKPTFSPARFCLLFTLEALKKSVEQRQELDDAIDQCEQAAVFPTPGGSTETDGQR